MKKTILITGGSEGLGKSIASLLSKDNNVIVISRSKNINDLSLISHFVCDITSYDQVKTTVDEIIKTNGNIDVLINNAGVWLAGDILDNTIQDIDKCIDVNLKGHIYMTKAVVHYMISNKQGLIINVCSQASFNSDEFSPIYNTAKWGMRGFTNTIQKSLSKSNIKVTGFYPGFMKTDLFKKAGNDYDTSSGLEVEKAAEAIKYIIDCDMDVSIPEFGIKSINNN